MSPLTLGWWFLLNQCSDLAGGSERIREVRHFQFGYPCKIPHKLQRAFAFPLIAAPKTRSSRGSYDEPEQQYSPPRVHFSKALFIRRSATASHRGHANCLHMFVAFVRAGPAFPSRSCKAMARRTIVPFGWPSTACTDTRSSSNDGKPSSPLGFPTVIR